MTRYRDYDYSQTKIIPLSFERQFSTVLFNTPLTISSYAKQWGRKNEKSFEYRSIDNNSLRTSDTRCHLYRHRSERPAVE